jgi:hypothetical protein
MLISYVQGGSLTQINFEDRCQYANNAKTQGNSEYGKVKSDAARQEILNVNYL